MHRIWRAIKPLAFLVLVLIAILSVSRVILVSLWWPRVFDADALGFIVIQGLRFDLILTGLALILPLLVMPLLISYKAGLSLWKLLLSVYIPLTIMLVLFMELATPSFAEQFDARPNILFFEYAAYTKELFATLWGAYRLQLMIGVPFVLLVGYFIFRHVRRSMQVLEPVRLVVSIPCTVALLIVCGLFIRSSFDHRPANPSTVARTTDAMINELPLSSTYTVAYAAYEMRHEESGGARYSNMDGATALDIVKREMHVSPDSFVSDMDGTWHMSEASSQFERPKNLVIILEESLGAEFVGSLGGLDLTPNIDALREKGWAFDRLYATGTRSVRGIEAVVTGFLPTPSRSVVKLTKSQRDFFTIGWHLKQKGYDTSFIYGGEAHFDNMRRFFMNNGFDTVVDENDYKNPVFVGSWGVSDEDLMARAHEEFSKPREKPFFSLVFSSSNHTPFEFPDGRIELFDEKKQTVNNAVKYADYAVGEFFKQARESTYWKDTIFLVVSDHNSRVYGADLVPVKRFHIPGVIIGEGIEPRHDARIMSQVDLAPTLLSLIGVSGIHPMPGRDYTKMPESVPGRAIMQFNGIQAYMENEEVVILQRDIKPETFIFDGSGLVSKDKVADGLIEKAIGHATWASDTYQSGAYKVKSVRNPQ